MNLSKKLKMLFGAITILTVVLYMVSSQIMVNYLYNGEKTRITGITSGCVQRLEGYINKVVGEGYRYKTLLTANNRIKLEHNIDAMGELEIIKQFNEDSFDCNVIMDTTYKIKYLINTGSKVFEEDEQLKLYISSKLPIKKPITGVVTTEKGSYIVAMMALAQDLDLDYIENKFFIGIAKIDEEVLRTVQGITNKSVEIIRGLDEEKVVQPVTLTDNKQLLLHYKENVVEAYYMIPQLSEVDNIYLKVVEPLVVQMNTRMNIMNFSIIFSVICVGIYSALWVVINKIIIKPIKQLNEGINDIKKSGDLSKRIRDINHKDEIGILTKDINQMFYFLEQEQLQRTMKDKRYKTLLNTMTNAYATYKVYYNNNKSIQAISCVEFNEAMAKLFNISVNDRKEDISKYIEMDMLKLENLRAILWNIETNKVPYYEEQVQLAKNTWGQVCLFGIEENQFSIMITDITKIKEYSDKMKYMANYDVLTGLKNRYSLYQHIDELINDTKDFSLYFMDLDNFKKLNDTIGHTEGDKILCIVAEELRKFSNNHTFISRVGGDEFIIIRRNEGGPGEITQFGESIIRILNTQFNYRRYNFELRVSIGVSICPFNGQDIESLLKYADIAMYQSKSKGGNCLEIFNDKMLEHMEIENKLKEAVENQEFVVYYQPVYHLEKHQIVGAEALVRWQKQDGAVLLPNKFIPIAKQTGDIIEIDYFVLDQACAFSKEWRMKGYDTFSVSVNISYRALNHPRFLGVVKEALDKHNLSPDGIKIEITEDEVIDSPKQVIMLLNRVRGMGIRVLLDDFGVGYSSFNHIKMLPIDTLKIDRSLIFKLEKDNKTLSIIETLIGLAHNLGLDVICEGIELEEQIAKLQGIGCDTIQGYYISQPVEPRLFEQYMLYYENKGGQEDIQ